MMIILIGKSCTGKTTILDKFRQDGYTCFEGSEIVRTIQKEKGYKNILDNEGKDIVGKYIHKMCKGVDTNVVVSGLRTEEEVDFLKNYYSLYIIALYISDEEAYRRNIKRARDHYDSFEKFYLDKICYDYSLGLAKLYIKNNLFIQEKEMTINEVYEMILQNIEMKLIGKV